MHSSLQIRILLLSLVLSILILISCGDNDNEKKKRGVYYWNTTFRLDSIKRDFLYQHNIDRIYVRYFDVVRSEGNDMPMPNATIRIDGIQDSLDWEIVPVVFIMPDALDCDREVLADRILKRVKQMSETHGMGTVKELQIDCDWTASTRQSFFDFMNRLKKKTSDEGVSLSSTIRLHQLAIAPPPADRGILMIYNTGDLCSIGKEKPILDPKDVKPYLKYLKGYPLPLATAYPIYRWDLLFRNGKFVDIVYDTVDTPILQSDTVVVRQPSVDDILMSRSAVEELRPDCANEIILFDLNNYNIKRYDHKTFESFYN